MSVHPDFPAETDLTIPPGGKHDYVALNALPSVGQFQAVPAYVDDSGRQVEFYDHVFTFSVEEAPSGAPGMPGTGRPVFPGTWNLLSLALGLAAGGLILRRVRARC